jgi:SAM-dependent methyltransferase
MFQLSEAKFMTPNLATLYRHRFDPDTLPRKNRIWKVLCSRFFQSYIGNDATVLDLACGYGEFISSIKAHRKIAVDLNPDSPSHLPKDVEFHATPATDLSPIRSGEVSAVFTSNFLEHLPNKQALDQVFAEVLRVLRPGGRFLILGPNVRYLPGKYWDFYDHHLPLSDRSLTEGLVIAGFDIEKSVDRFLPYTTQSSLPQHPALVALYLRFPLAWRFMGKQFFIVARKNLGSII